MFYRRYVDDIFVLFKKEEHFKLYLNYLNSCHRFSTASMDASQIHLWDVSYSVSETYQRGLIWKSLRRLSGDRNLCGIFIQEKRLFRPNESSKFPLSFLDSIISKILTFSHKLLSVRRLSRKTTVVPFPLTTQRKDSI